jgi:iron uptake system component EfeO
MTSHRADQLLGTVLVSVAVAGWGGSGAAVTSFTTTSLAVTTQSYHDYVVTEVGLLAETTKQLTNAIRAGDMAQAEQAYPLARLHYEHIESVADGDLAASIDARIEEVANPDDWTGFHCIEKALWQDKTLAGMMSTVADKLDADVATLKAKVADATYSAEQPANDAGDLLTKVSTITVLGAEDRYSHTDLWDFAANIEGARTIFGLLKPTVAAKNADLAQQIDARFADMTDKLSKYRQGDGYVNYNTVSEDQRRELADSVNALAESLSTVTGLVV